DDHRYPARRVPLVLGEAWHQRRLGIEEAVALLTLGHGRPGLEVLGSDLDGHDRVGNQVVVPGRVGWGGALGGDDHVAVAVPRVHERCGVGRPALSALRGQQHDGRSLENSLLDLSRVGSELLYNVPVDLCHVDAHRIVFTFKGSAPIPRVPFSTRLPNSYALVLSHINTVMYSW